MNAFEILQAYYQGQISLSECWRQLADLRPQKRDEPVIQAPPSKVYEPLNEYELKGIALLQNVHFGMARSSKRFIEQVKEKKELTARQREYVQLLVYRYRRQLFGKSDQQVRAFIQKMKGR